MLSPEAKNIQEIIDMYDEVIKNVDKDAKNLGGSRSYGGYIRAKKGKLLEDIAESLIFIAWQELGGVPSELSVHSKKINMPIQDGYISNITDENVRDRIKNEIDGYNYKLSVDKHIYVRDNFVLAMECKSYTENAMIKRICVDFDMLKKMHPEISCYLLQLESQLGGDYSQLQKTEYGSISTHTIMSYFPVDLKIITLLKGERKVDKPIHKNNYKPLKLYSIRKALDLLKSDLKKYII